MSAPTREQALSRYKKFMRDAEPEHHRVLRECAAANQAYGGNSIQGQDFADLAILWGPTPPEIPILLANVDAFLGSLMASRKEATFPGVDTGLKDEALGGLLNILIRQARRWAGSDREDKGTLKDQILSGLSFSKLTLDTQGRPPYRPTEEHVLIDRVRWDKWARKENLLDGQDFSLDEPYGLDEAIAKWPDFEEAFRALTAGAGDSKESQPGAGARATLNSPAAAVTVSAADGSSPGGSAGGSTPRRREILVRYWEFLHFESLVHWQGPDGAEMETSAEDFTKAIREMGDAAMQAGIVFSPPEAVPVAASSWYSCRVLAKTATGEPQVLTDPEPIPGNQRLIRALTGKYEDILEGETFVRRWFGWGRILLGLQRLASTAIRIELEQESRRGRESEHVENGAFDSDAEFQAYVRAKRMPGAVLKIKDGAHEKIHPVADSVGSRVDSIRQLFQWLAIDLPRYILGISDMNRGTFEGDRSVKFLDTMLQTSLQMQSDFTSSYTYFLDEGAVALARLLLGPEGLDAEDIDTILGHAGEKPREGITHEKDESGQLVPIMIPDPDGEPQMDPATGAMVPATRPMTAGRYLKDNLRAIFDHEISFGFRPAAASERAANAQLMLQHGNMGEMLKAGAPPHIVIPYMIRASFQQGTEFSDMAAELDVYYAEQKQQEEAQAQAASEEGWVAFIQNLAKTDFEKAAELMQQATDAVAGPQSGGAPEVPT